VRELEDFVSDAAIGLPEKIDITGAAARARHARASGSMLDAPLVPAPAAGRSVCFHVE
jgi:hypothetical protein